MPGILVSWGQTIQNRDCPLEAGMNDKLPFLTKTGIPVEIYLIFYAIFNCKIWDFPMHFVLVTLVTRTDKTNIEDLYPEQT